MRVGLDIGSTTIKCVVLDENDTLLYSTYERHYSHILEKAQELLRRIDAEQLHGRKALLSISGSAGMGLADSCGVPFVQEVFSTRVAVKKFVPATDCVIELGGEDAKILFLTNGTEVRMNGSCAGGTGAFIDQMATLLKMGADEMDKAQELNKELVEMAAEHDEALMELYFDKGTLTQDDIRSGLKIGLANREVMPIFCTSGKRDIGTKRLMANAAGAHMSKL